MAVNTNKRIPVKWVRDRAKSAYTKQTECFICNTSQELELHHTHSITLLLESWSRGLKIDISTDDAILAVRDDFIQAHHKEIYDDVFTLCNKHHVALHSVFGKAPSLSSAEKQRIWIDNQKAKLTGGTLVSASTLAPKQANPLGNFGKFIRDQYGLVRFQDLVSTGSFRKA